MCRLGRQLQGREAMDMFALRPAMAPGLWPECGRKVRRSSTTSGEHRDRVDDVLATVENKQNLLGPGESRSGRAEGVAKRANGSSSAAATNGQDKAGSVRGARSTKQDAVSIIGLSGMSQPRAPRSIFQCRPGPTIVRRTHASANCGTSASITDLPADHPSAEARQDISAGGWLVRPGTNPGR